MDKVDIGVVVGRFQVSTLTTGHRALLDYAMKNSKEVIVVLGVNPTPPTVRNPLDFETRRQMLEAFFGTSATHRNTIVVPHADRQSDDAWTVALEKLIRSIRPNGSVALFHGRDSFQSHYSGKFRVEQVPEVPSACGTDTRTEVCAAPRSNTDFRAGAIYATKCHFPRAFATVDIMCYRPSQSIPEGIDILLIRKSKTGLWQLPGGFVDAKDSCYEAAARRELTEETGAEVNGVYYVGTYKVDDWRYRDVPDKIITTLFAAPFTNGAVRPMDDVADGDVTWSAVSPATIHLIAPIHKELVRSGLLYITIKREHEAFKKEAANG